MTTASEPRPSDSSAPDRFWVFVALALAGAAFLLLFAAVPHTVTADGSVRFMKLDALLRQGSVSGERFSYIGPLFASPLWMSGDPLWWCGRFNVLVLAVGAVAAWRILPAATGSAERGAFVLLLVAAGMMPNAVRDFYGELFSAVLVGTGLLIVTVRGKSWGWGAVVLGVANMPASAVGLALAAAARLVKSRRADGLAALLAAAALIALENTVTRGHPLATGYFRDHGYVTVLPFSGKPGFSYPMILGVLSLLFSFGKGLLFFAPGLLLVPHARRIRPALADFFDLSVAFAAGLLLVYSQWWSWYGGWTWGPRFLLFAAYPSALALAVSLSASAGAIRSLAVVVIALWTVWVGVSGVVFDLEGLEACIANRYALEHLCWYVPEYSPLLHHFVLPPQTLAAWQQAWMLLATIVVAVVLTSGPALTRIGSALAQSTRMARRR